MHTDHESLKLNYFGLYMLSSYSHILSLPSQSKVTNDRLDSANNSIREICGNFQEGLRKITKEFRYDTYTPGQDLNQLPTYEEVVHTNT